MTISTRFFNCVAVSALMVGQAAADVTPEEVWQSWLDLAQSGGQVLTEGARSRQGDSLIVTDLKSETVVPAGGGRIAFSIPQVSLRDMGDGRVEITTAETYTIEGSLEGADGHKQDIDGAVTQSGMKVIVSGTPDAMSFDYQAAALDYMLNMQTPEPKMSKMEVAIKLSDMAGNYLTEPREGGYATGGTAQISGIGVIVKGDVKGDETAGMEPGTIDMNLSYGPTTMEHSTFMPAGATLADFGAALTAGAEVRAKVALGPANYMMNGTDADKGDFTLTGKDTGGLFDFDMADGRFSYDVQGNGLAMSVSTPELPFPMEFGMEKMGLQLAMPVAKTEELVPYSFGMDVSKLSVSESLWAMGDPMGKLPHDPVSMKIDLDGTATMPVDMFDPESVENADDDENPFAGGDLNIKTVMLEALGASVVADGKLTIPAADAGPDAMPVGEISAKGTGINALLDNLVAIGLVPEDDVMGARMMLALFTQPDGEDGMVSKIEFSEDGGIFANGQRIQ